MLYAADTRGQMARMSSVAARAVLDERVLSADHAGRAELRQTPYGSQPRLESSVIGLDRIISVLLNNVTRGRQQLIECPRVGGRLVGAHLSRVRIVLEGAGEELAGGTRFRCSDATTSMIWPYWSIAQYRNRASDRQP